MKKIRLSPESLEVLSFDAGEAQARFGTVEAHAGAAGQASYSCLYPCRPRTYGTDCDC